MHLRDALLWRSPRGYRLLHLRCDEEEQRSIKRRAAAARLLGNGERGYDERDRELYDRHYGCDRRNTSGGARYGGGVQGRRVRGKREREKGRGGRGQK